MGLLDVNALVALAWDTHVHHARMREWFATHGEDGVGDLPGERERLRARVVEPEGAPEPDRRRSRPGVLAALRAAACHSSSTDDVSLADADVPESPATDR